VGSLGLPALINQHIANGFTGRLRKHSREGGERGGHDWNYQTERFKRRGDEVAVNPFARQPVTGDSQIGRHLYGVRFEESPMKVKRCQEHFLARCQPSWFTPRRYVLTLLLVHVNIKPCAPELIHRPTKIALKFRPQSSEL
jgi:hypothetical protein